MKKSRKILRNNKIIVILLDIYILQENTHIYMYSRIKVGRSL